MWRGENYVVEVMSGSGDAIPEGSGAVFNRRERARSIPQHRSDVLDQIEAGECLRPSKMLIATDAVAIHLLPLAEVIKRAM